MTVSLPEMVKKSPLLMGIVNVTPDSFSDGGSYASAQAAIAHGKVLLEQGADILDIGGESTRPNATPVTIDEEIRRIVPVIEGLHGIAPYISADTRNAEAMAAAINAGANIINDVSALSHDSESIDVIAQSGVPVCLMHMQGTPQTMQISPLYDNVVDDVLYYLTQRIEYCIQKGVKENQIILDVGIGFGKTLDHNLSLIKNLDRFHALGCPLLLGVSRKSFIAALSKNEPPQDRVSGSIAAALWGFSKNVSVFRVHDVAATRQAFQVYQGIVNA